jgi:pimeloyl-ACP methyl ester carboxylesterase
MKFLRVAARCLLWATLSAVLFLASCQSRLIYYPRPYDKAALMDIQQRGGRQIEFKTSQGRQVAFYLPPPNAGSQPPALLWFVFGGNGALALDYSGETARWDARAGYLFVDYPGYGLCDGSPNPAHIEESVVALATKLKGEWHWTDADLSMHSGVFGHSIGSAAALITADRLHINRAVLCAPFTTMTDMTRRTIGWPLCYLNRHQYDNLARLRTLSERGAQVRIFHATGDQAIPVSMARTLAKSYPKIVRLTEVADSDHNEVVHDAGAEIGTAMRELAAPSAR